MKEEYKNFFLNSEQIGNICKEKKLILFGAGADGSRFYRRNYHRVSVSYFVDNGDIEGYTIYGKRIVDGSYLQKHYQNEIILITSLKYKSEIAEQLENNGFQPGIHFWIWNGRDTAETINFEDNNTKEFIEFNKRLWKKEQKEKSKNKILMPYRRTVEIVYAPWSYAANYLAEKYDADIYCIGGVGDVVESDLWGLYQSFNVAGFIDETLNESMNEERDKIFHTVWKNIKCEEDLKEIEIYGENYGVDILRDYLRLEFPRLYMNDWNLKKQVKRMIGYVIFWSNYIKENAGQIKSIIVWDGLYYREGILRKIAYSYDIPVYSIVNTTCFKWEYDLDYSFPFYKKFFNMLSEQEKRDGINWAKRKLEKHLAGNTDDMVMFHKSVFEVKCDENVLETNDKIKIMICPHYTEDDAFPYGDMFFTDPWDWLEYLGELSNNTDYDWYLKPHPIEKELGDKLIEEYVERYPNIKLLPKFVSPIQLKKEGMKFALTIHGSIGYEYPLIGIDVINAGYNPHIAFDFDWNPKSKEEYEHILMNLQTAEKTIDKEEIYQFYCIHFGYYIPRRQDLMNVFFKDSRLQDVRGLVGSKTKYTTDLFKYYMEETSETRHEELKKIYADLFKDMDQYKEGVFYKRGLM